MRIGTVILALSSFAPAAFAQAEATPADPPATPSSTSGEDIASFDLEKLLDVDVGASTKTELKPAEAPSIVSVVSRDQMNAFGWMSLNDILYKQPGFFPGRDYERRTVGFRGQFEGWNNNHLLLLIDGVPFNDNETGGAFTWEITPLFFARNVEIVRGPGSALYGSTAVNGVLAINTVSPKDFGGSFLEGRAQLGYPLAQSYDVMGGAETQFADVTLAFNLFDTDGFEYQDFDSSYRRDADGKLQQFTVQDNRNSHYFFGKAQGRGAFENVSLQLHHQAWEYETAQGWLFHAPDVREKMQESRQIVALSWRPQTFDAVKQEYVLRYQRHNLHHNMRFFENGAFDGYYPDGVTEFIESSFDELFARGQLTWNIGGGASLLGGVEYTGFLYLGDQAHFANAALADAANGYPPTDGFQPLGPYYEWILGHPVHNFAAFSQLESGRMLGGLASVTLGLRYDGQFFDYTDIFAPGRPTVSKSFQQLSPRVGVVLFPVEDLTFKILAGRAFRQPAPLELFGANSFAIASNLYELKPETLSSYELGADWRIMDGLTWRTNAFYLDLQNQIAYGSLNILVNIYSHAIAGAETELLFSADTPLGGKVGGFVNYTYARLVSETVNDETIAAADVLTWAPEHSAKAGATLSVGPFQTSLQGLFQGPVARRSSDQVDPDFAAVRPDVVDPWVTFDAMVKYHAAKWMSVGLNVKNIVDSPGPIVRPGVHPFDYRTDGRSIFGVAEFHL